MKIAAQVISIAVSVGFYGAIIVAIMVSDSAWPLLAVLTAPELTITFGKEEEK